MRAHALLLSLLLLGPGCRKEAPSRAPAPPTTAQRPAAPPQPGRRVLPRLVVPTAQPGTLLGGELGLDHVGVAVRDLEAARQSYEKLGFASPSAGKLPNGIQNINYYFKDTTYLETMSAWDDQKATWLARFTRQHEGAYFLALCVHSAEETAAFLGQRGFETFPPRPGSIQTQGGVGGPAEMWKTLLFKRSPFPEGSLFFIAYHPQIRQKLFDNLRSRSLRRRYFTHPNTALGVRAAWMAVRSAEPVWRAFQSMGLAPGRALQLDALGARGRLVPAGIGDVLVLEPSAPGGKLAAFLAARGEGLLGLSVQVHRLGVARARIEKATGQTLAPQPGFYGPALLLPPELTHGAWMELSE